MHWFRAKHDTCPLCNNHGHNQMTDVSWGSRQAAMENYKKLRRQSRRKNAPKELKKAVEKIKRLEKREKKRKEEFKKFKNEIAPPGKTRRELYNEWEKMRIKCHGWRFKNKLAAAKFALGYTNIIPLIVVQKVNI